MRSTSLISALKSLRTKGLFGSFVGAVVMSIAAVFLLAASAPAQTTQTWDQASGTWDTTTSNWSGSTWTNGNNAVFGGTTGSTITIDATGITANALQFNVANQTVAGDPATSKVLGFTSTSATMNVTVDSGLTATAGSFQGPAASSGAGNKIAVLGGGTLNLNGTNNLVTGDSNVNQSAGFSVNGGSTLNITGTLYAMSPTATGKTYFTNQVGDTSANNTVNISGSGVATTGLWAIGGGSFGGNTVNLSAPGSATTPTLRMVGSGLALNVGTSSSNNSLNLTNGAVATASAAGGTSTWTLGVNAGANGNSITVSGTNTVLSRSGAGGSYMNVGGAGDNNTMTVSNGGTFNTSRIAVGANGGDNNTATFTGANSLFFSNGGSNGFLNVGLVAASVGNALKIENGAKANVTGTGTTRNFDIGTVATADSNYIRVTGTGSSMNMNIALPFGIGVKATGTAATVGGNSNSLQVYDGGSFVSTAPIYVGSSVAIGGTESTNNSLSIGNGTSNIATVTVNASASQFNTAAGYDGVYTVPGTTTAVAVQTSSYTVPSTGSLTAQGIFLNGATSTLNFNNGRLVAGSSSTGTLVSGSGTVNLNGPAYVSTALGNSVISSLLTGTGSLTKEGSGLLTLSNASNSYLGNTTVSGGTLSLAAAFLADAATVTLASGTVLDLNYLGNDTIGNLILNGVTQAAGTYGTLGSGAQFETASLSGTGLLNVAAVVPEPQTMVLLGAGLAALGFLRRRRHA
jgi:hypothetical protein